MGTVLGKCTDLDKCKPGVGRKKIGLKRVAGRHDDPNQQSRGGNMHKPISEPLPTPSAYFAKITAHETILRNYNADQQAARKGRVEHMQALRPSRKA